MALLFIDGFDHYATADIGKKWSAATSNLQISAAGGRRGGGGLTHNSTSQTISKVLATSAQSVICGFALTHTAITTTTGTILQFTDTTTAHITLTWDGAGRIQVRRGTSSGTILGTSVLTMSNNTYYYLECKVSIDDTAGTYEVRVNGVNWVSGSPEGLGSPTQVVDTRNGANATVNVVTIGLINTTQIIDDVYICDTSGSTNNDFLGDCRVDVCTPNADGNYADFTPSTGVSHYQLVDESTPNTSDYNESSTIGARDSYGLTDLSAMTGTIYGAQSYAAVAKDDAGLRLAKVGVRTNTGGSPGSTALSSSVSMSTNQVYVLGIHETDPSTGVAWTESGLNGAELVVEAD